MEFMAKLSKVYDFFHALAEKEGGEVVCDNQPESTHADVVVKIPLFELHADGAKQFVDVLQYVDSFDVTSDASNGLVIRAGVSREDAE